MLAVTRREAIKDLVYERKSVTVSELATDFSVSTATIRRDLTILEDGGFLNKTHGGAYVEYGAISEVDYEIRKNIMVENKLSMASYCAREFISNGDTIFLDASTTVTSICEFITSMRLTVLTSSLVVANKLSSSDKITVISPGGTLSSSSMSFGGFSAVDNLKKYYVDKAFISCEALSMEHGLTDSNEEQAKLRQTIIDCSDETYLLADNTKFDKACFITFNNFTGINGIVTDAPVSHEWKDFLEQKKIEIVSCHQ